MYDILYSNSINEKSNLINEAVEAEYYQTMVGNVLKDKIRFGLFYNIADVQPAKQPVGVIFARVESTDDSGNETFEIKSQKVDIVTHKSIAKISVEGFEDLLKLSTYNEDKNPTLFENFVKSVAGHKEVSTFLTQIKARAKDAGKLTLTGTEADSNAEVNLFIIHKYVNELVLKMNQDNFRTYDAFCILPSSGVGGILGLGATYSKISQQGTDARAHDYFLTTINNVKYYINPDKSETSAIVGLYSTIDKSANSLIYCPFSILTSAVDNPDNGEKTLAVFVRSGLAINPLHTDDKPMLFKFAIESTPVETQALATPVAPSVVSTDSQSAVVQGVDGAEIKAKIKGSDGGSVSVEN